jgi:Ser/Thr protein kinase RdoA (MazF antagonist)
MIPGTSISEFDALTRGAAAPDWLAAGIAMAWGLDPVRTAITLITVSENATFLLRRDGDPVAVVRVARPGYLAGTQDVASEVAWVRALAQAGVVRVPAAHATLDGGYVATVTDAAGGPWTCVSYGFVPGRILEDLLEDDAGTDAAACYEEIGRTTARLHEHQRRWPLPAGFRRHTWDLPDMLGDSCRWGRWETVAFPAAQRRLLDAAQERAVAALAGHPRSASAWGLIHADLRPSNIMIGAGPGQDGLTVIDFDDCGFSWLMYDFAAAFTFIEHRPDAAAMARRWVAGYRQVRELGEADAVAGCALSMVRRLQMLGWITTHRQDALPPALWAAQPGGTVEVAEKYLRSATWLLD